MTLSVTSMNFYGIYRGVYDIETGFYDIEVGVYEIDGRAYEMAPSEEQMLLQRHRRLTADAEPVRGSLRGVSLREAWYGPPDSAVGCVTSLFRGAESSYFVSWRLLNVKH